ncbi:MAG: GNAT family N-acetyltransferase [Proteobacteria bacterium]|nr:GNAT family N-acetyltransferase [Pseudomonadota bacterium]
MRIVDLKNNDPHLVTRAAELLVAGFSKHWPKAWPTFEKAKAAVEDMLRDDRLAFGILDTKHQLLGWVGGIPQYNGCVMEVHPLVVASQSQRQGIGMILLKELEQRSRELGALTLLARLRLRPTRRV